jgi:hypothetical protein
MRWLAPAADPAVALTHRPTECLGAAATPGEAYGIELGRAAFRTPLVLGGQAARVGVSCETCHRSGRDNPDFDFRGVSGAPGTADVSTPVLSSHRTEATFSPKPIPNLSGPKSALTTDQATPGALEKRIDTILTQEFDGAEPPPAVLKGLAAYVRALSPASCPAAATARVTSVATLGDARRAVHAALAALEHGDGPSAIVMAEAARSQLGEADERYAGPGLAAERQALAAASVDLAAAEEAIRRDPKAGADALTLWLAREPGWAAPVLAAEPRSLYAPTVLAAAAKAYKGE